MTYMTWYVHGKSWRPFRIDLFEVIERVNEGFDVKNCRLGFRHMWGYGQSVICTYER